MNLNNRRDLVARQVARTELDQLVFFDDSATDSDMGNDPLAAGSIGAPTTAADSTEG